MVTETAHLTIDPARAAEFEAAVAAAADAFRGAVGCRGMALERVIETPGQYRLRVEWDSVEDHMVTFRNAPAFQTWRGLAGPFFLQPPVVDHSETVAVHF